MIKDMAWKFFKNTGDIETALEIIRLEDIEKNIKAENNGNSKNEGNYHLGK